MTMHINSLKAYLVSHLLVPRTLPKVCADDKSLGEVLVGDHAQDDIASCTGALLAVLVCQLLLEAKCAGCSADNLL